MRPQSLTLFLFKKSGTSFLCQEEKGLFRNLITVNTLGLFKIGFQEACRMDAIYYLLFIPF